MANPKDILVITTSSIDGIKVKQYLKPISAHIVAGTNLFSDFFASLSDVFGGRSQTYQNQLTSLYNEAIEKIKFAAYEIGANCVIGLSIDMDEISGKGKSMFMLTAVGTAVIIDKEVVIKSTVTQTHEKFENVSVERIIGFNKKKTIIEKSIKGDLSLDDETWNFITSNQVVEVFPYLLKKYLELLEYEQTAPEISSKFYRLLTTYIDALPDDKKTVLLYFNISNEKNENLVLKLCNIVKELNLLDLNKTLELLKSSDFQRQKIGLRIITYDKAFYNKQDITDLQIIKEYIETAFIERGTRTTKKQLLSSKEKEVWNCECGKTNNEIDSYCSSCNKDIYGFKANEIKPLTVSKFIQQKIDLIAEYVE